MRIRLAVSGLLLALLALTPGIARAGFNSCHPYGKKACLLPFPDNRLTVKDPRTATGLRVHLPAKGMPVNLKGERTTAKEYNRSDGFSPGGMIVVHIPGLDTAAAFHKNALVPLQDMGRAFDRNQRVLLLDASTGKRQLIWAELDATTSPADSNLLIHSGKNLLQGHRYVVVLRNLHDATGKRLARPLWFGKSIRQQPKRYRSIFKTLAKANVTRRSLYLSWDFTVISRQSETGRLLHIRNDAFGQLGDHNLADGKVTGVTPKFTVDTVEDNPAGDPQLMRKIAGTITVPCYLDKTGCPSGARFHYSSTKPDALPTQIPGNTIKASFVCNIPKAAATAPARISLYGHGLLGDPTEIDAGNVKDMSQEHDFVFCATRWIGLSDEDIGNAAGILGNLDGFPSLTDRVQQGVLDMLYLGRAMLHPNGLVKNAAFQSGGHPLIDTRHLYYDGNSQGGIEGGITTAVAPDYTRAVLGVPGMDYGGLLLARSVDFDAYLTILRGAYPDESERPLIYAGGGVMLSAAWQELRTLAEMLEAPVVMSTAARGALRQCMQPT